MRRTTRQVTLTDAGERLLPLAREVLAGIDRLRSTSTNEPRTVPYEFVIGTRYELGLSWLCPALDPLARKRPERTVHLYNGGSSELIRQLERGDLDAVVTSARLTSPRLAYAALHTEEYAFVGVDRCVRTRDDARRLTLVDISPDLPLFRYFLDALDDAEPWPFDRVEFMGGIANIRYRLLEQPRRRAGAGRELLGGRVAVLPRYFIQDDLAHRRLVTLMPRVRLRTDAFRLVWRAGHPREADLVTLAADLRELPLR